MTAVERRDVLVGLEQEFELFQGAWQVDFHALLHSALEGVAWRPFRGRPDEVILDAGYVLSCDAAEAEYATVPVSMADGGPGSLVAEALRCRAHFLELLRPLGLDGVRGYSTHLNVSLPDEHAPGAGWLAASTIGPALVLLLDGRASPGLFYRERRNRLEIGSEYVDSPRQLLAAVTFVAGIAHAWDRVRADRGLPRVRVARWGREIHRGGLYLPVDSYGDSIHAHGGAARLVEQSGEQTTAGEVLRRYATIALDALDGFAEAGSGAAALRAAVADTRVLQISRPDHDVARVEVRPSRADPAPAALAYGSVAVQPAGAALEPVFVDWAGCAFAIRNEPAPYLGVPAAELLRVMELSASGYLGELLDERPEVARLLYDVAQFDKLRLFESIDVRALSASALSDKGGGKRLVELQCDHYLSYKTMARERRVIALRDQFIGADPEFHAVGKLRRLLAPAVKRTALRVERARRPDAHLTEYGVAPERPGPAPLDRVLVNQFGRMRVKLSPPDRLLLPAAKSRRPPPPERPPQLIDHYLGYPLKPHHPFEPVVVDARDQFSGRFRRLAVLKPERLFVPASKDGAVIHDAECHLVSYRVKRLRELPAWLAALANCLRAVKKWLVVLWAKLRRRPAPPVSAPLVAGPTKHKKKKKKKRKSWRRAWRLVGRWVRCACLRRVRVWVRDQFAARSIRLRTRQPRELYVPTLKLARSPEDPPSPPVREPEPPARPAPAPPATEWPPADDALPLVYGGTDQTAAARAAIDAAWQAFESLAERVSDPDGPNETSRRRIEAETGVTVDANPYFGVTPVEVAAVVRAAHYARQRPEVLLALWAREGSTRSHLDYRLFGDASSVANARSLFRSYAYYDDLGADHFVVTRYDPEVRDNVLDRSDEAAHAHEERFAARVRELAAEGLLPGDVSDDVNAAIGVRGAPGRYYVRGSVRFYGLSLLLTDAYFTRLRRTRYDLAPDLSVDLNYVQWNVGPSTFRRFLESAEVHRHEPEYTVGGEQPTIEEWALHRPPKEDEWRQVRVNAIRFMHYVRAYTPAFTAVPW